MSFSSEIKTALAARKEDRPCCLLTELSALTQTLGSLALRSRGQLILRYQTGSPAVARRIFLLLKELFSVSATLSFMKDGRFGVKTKSLLSLDPAASRRVLLRLDVIRTGQTGERFGGVPRRLTRRQCCKRAFLRGMFLGCGTVSNPLKGYHAEFNVQDGQRARFLQRALADSGIEASIRAEKPTVYIKAREDIVRLLGLIGASQAMLHMENIMAQKSLKAKVLRATNCDSGNLKKQLMTAERQIEAINRISRMVGLNVLDEESERLARLRLVHPDASLAQLGQMMQPAIDKNRAQRLLAGMEKLSAGITEKKPTEYTEAFPAVHRGPKGIE